MIFAAPQWRWRLCHRELDYGFVHNRVVICPLRGRSAVAQVVIPSEFFQLLPLLFHGKKLRKAKRLGVDFFMEEDGDRWIMGVEIADGSNSIFLWPYTKSQLPAWFDVARRKTR